MGTVTQRAIHHVVKPQYAACLALTPRSAFLSHQSRPLHWLPARGVTHRGSLWWVSRDKQTHRCMQTTDNLFSIAHEVNGKNIVSEKSCSFLMLAGTKISLGIKGRTDLKLQHQLFHLIYIP